MRGGRSTDEIKEIGKAQSSTIFEETIKANEKLIKELENNILDYKKKIGNCFYKSIPYLVLSDLTRKSVLCLSQEAKDNAIEIFKKLLETATDNADLKINITTETLMQQQGIEKPTGFFPLLYIMVLIQSFKRKKKIP